MPITDFAGPIWVTIAYFALYYTMLFGGQSITKFRLMAEYKARGEKFSRYAGTDNRMLAADRIVGNTIEQMGPFLAGLWLCAVFVSPATATGAGSAYVAFRAVYPFLMWRMLAQRKPGFVMLSTIPGYGIIYLLYGLVVWELVQHAA